MTKQSDTLRHLRAAAAATAVFAAIFALPTASRAQNGPDDPPGAFEAPAPGAAPGAEGGADSPAPTRAEILDALFAELAVAPEAAAPRIEKRIQDIWSRSGSDTMDLLLRRGRDALNAEDPLKASRHFSALVEHAPDFAEGWNMRATAFYLQGEWGLALADIERALALEPRHWGALTGLGMILEQIGREREALAAFREALRINPNIPRAVEAVERLAPTVDGRDI